MVWGKHIPYPPGYEPWSGTKLPQRSSVDGSVTVSDASVLALPSNDKRLWALLINDDDNVVDMFLRLGSAVTASTFIKLEPGDYYVIDDLHPWNGEVYVIASASGTATLYYIEVQRRK